MICVNGRRLGLDYDILFLLSLLCISLKPPEVQREAQKHASFCCIWELVRQCESEIVAFMSMRTGRVWMDGTSFTFEPTDEA